ncbi:hypothetical protein NHX12_023782 [Muraenolepis orangiensis]|uniref:Uncharacterized protein n=1 Tax=Muraenolepis orangiensis TaxID=630683 RepID=A0A9Q0EP85_9TELE|nr:hypothetical protein NHX12_023782 [Muraenolepis orangiensis]
MFVGAEDLCQEGTSKKMFCEKADYYQTIHALRILRSPGLLQDQGLHPRPQSSEILDQLLSQGIIPAAPPGERRSGPGEAYNIMLDDGEVPRRRPPARLESLKERKEQISPSRESIDHKMLQAEERRKQKEDELKTRLRTKSARVRASAAFPAESEDQQSPQTPVSTDTPDPQAHTQVFDVQA